MQLNKITYFNILLKLIFVQDIICSDRSYTSPVYFMRDYTALSWYFKTRGDIKNRELTPYSFKYIIYNSYCQPKQLQYRRQ